MNRSGKVLTILLIVVLLILASSTAVIYYYYDQERAQRITLAKGIEELQAAKKQLEMKIKASEDTVGELNNKLAEFTMTINDLTSALETEKATQQQLVSERDSLTSTLSEKTSSLQGLQNQLSQTNQQIKTLEERIAQLQAEKEQAQKAAEQPQPAAAATPQEVGLGTIVVASGEIPSGEIVSINKDHQFIVMNLGEQDGVIPGQIFSVFRGKAARGTLQVERVENALAVANLIEDTKIASLRVGDTVTVKR